MSLSVDGQVPDPKPAIKLLEDVPCDTLPEVLIGILPELSFSQKCIARRQSPSASGACLDGPSIREKQHERRRAIPSPCLRSTHMN